MDVSRPRFLEESILERLQRFERPKDWNRKPKPLRRAIERKNGKGVSNPHSANVRISRIRFASASTQKLDSALEVVHCDNAKHEKLQPKLMDDVSSRDGRCREGNISRVTRCIR